MNSSELIGPALDWAVAKCNGKTLHYFVDDWFKKDPWLAVDGEADQPLHSYTPSTDWGQGGPIIESEYIQLTIDLAWEAHIVCEDKKFGGVERFGCTGPTPLIAAMRCFVASRLGDEVEIPEELK